MSRFGVTGPSSACIFLSSLSRQSSHKTQLGAFGGFAHPLQHCARGFFTCPPSTGGSGSRICACQIRARRTRRGMPRVLDERLARLDGALRRIRCALDEPPLNLPLRPWHLAVLKRFDQADGPRLVIAGEGARPLAGGREVYARVHRPPDSRPNAWTTTARCSGDSVGSCARRWPALSAPHCSTRASSRAARSNVEGRRCGWFREDFTRPSPASPSRAFAPSRRYPRAPGERRRRCHPASPRAASPSPRAPLG